MDLMLKKLERNIQKFSLLQQVLRIFELDIRNKFSMTRNAMVKLKTVPNICKP